MIFLIIIVTRQTFEIFPGPIILQCQFAMNFLALASCTVVVFRFSFFGVVEAEVGREI